MLDRATEVGSFLGTDPSIFPRDFAVFAKVRRDLARVRGRQPVPAQLRWEEVADFLTEFEQVEGLTEQD